jgi:hypothetical protein
MKDSKVQVRHQVNVPSELMWETISAIGGVDVWFSQIIKSCEVIGEGAGAKRICNTDAGPIKESIDIIDHENRLFQYSILEQNLLPVKNLVGTMQVEESEGQTFVKWEATFKVDPSAEAEIQNQLKGFYVAGINGIAALHQQAA